MVKRFRIILLLAALLPSCQPAPEGLEPSASIVSGQLSHPQATCFRQDAEGRMWIGTERGLNRYNGYDFHQYYYASDSTALPDNRIYDICLDQEGRLWVGTEDGVALYTGEDRFRRVPIASEEKAVYQVLCDRKGQIILNMLEDLCVYNPDTGIFTSAVVGFDRFYSYHARCHLDGNGLLWVVSPREIRCFETDDFKNVDNFITLHWVTESLLLQDGLLWMAGDGRLSVLDTRTGIFHQPPEKVVRSLQGRQVEILFEPDSTTVLIKTSDGQFLLYDRQQDLVRSFSGSELGLPDGFDAKTFFLDGADALWVGSDDKGFHYDPYFRERLGSGRPRHLLKGKSTVSMSLDPSGALWLFTRHDGIYRYDTATGALEHPSVTGLPAEDRTDYLQTNEPLVFAPSNGDLWLVFPNQQHLLRGRYRNGVIHVLDEYPAFYPRAALEDKEGGIWFGTRNEFLVHFPPGGKALERVQIYPLQTTYIHCLHLLGDDILIGAYDEPLRLLNIHTRKIRSFDLGKTDWKRLIGNDFFYPTIFLQDSRGDLWIGTRYNGLLHFDTGLQVMTTVPGMHGREVSSLEEDGQGRIWISMAAGLATLTPPDSAPSDYYSPQGTDDACFYWRASEVLPDGTLAFGGADGVTLIDPNESVTSPSVPLVFEDLKVHNQRVLTKGSPDDIVLAHRDNAFSLSFAVPDFRNIPRLQYAYKLEGYDRDWVEIGPLREAYFANIPAGRYTLRVRSFLYPDRLSAQESTLSIRILPSPWLSWWAIFLYALLALALSVYVLRLRRHVLQEKAAVREAEREKEQERKVNRMNMTFFSNISHEFRTPLTMISGPVSELSQSSRIEEKDRRKLGLVRHSVDRMLSLVNQLMDLGKLENASLRLQVRKKDLVPLLHGVLAIFRFNAASRGLQLEERGLEYPMPAWVDDDKVQKILENLLSNALKFTPKGGTVAFEADEVQIGGKPYVQISVSDTGPGIPEDQREKIFDRYYQLDNQRQGKYNYGTGIGLFYARSLAELHHGTLTVDSRPGGSGSVFTLSLPNWEGAYSEQELQTDGHPVNKELPMETVPAILDTARPEDAKEGNRPTLLAIDDDPDILRYLDALLSESYDVLTALSAEEGFTLAMDRGPDIILSDVAMPGKDGFELCRDLKSNLQICHIPVILVTAMGTVQNQVQGLDLGADAYVTKPFDPSYLKALIKSQLENRHRIQKMVNDATESSEVDTLSARDRSFLDHLYALMEKEISNEDLDISLLTGMLGISRTKLYYKIKGLTGKTPGEFFTQYKLNVAAKLLLEGNLNVSEISIRTGFSTPAHFSKVFKKQFGVPPSKYGGQ